MRITYLTWGETPRVYGVFGSQVLGQVRAMSDLFPEIKIDLVSGVPIVHSGLIREKWSYYKQISSIREMLADSSFLRVPIFAPQNFIYPSKKTFFLFHNFLAYISLHGYLKKNKPNIVHCRGYHAAYAALNIKSKYKLSYKIVFDPRGLWPEEMLLKKGGEVDNLDYQYFKVIEKKLLRESDATIAVSDTMAEYFREICPETRSITTVYLSSKEIPKVNQLKNFKRKPGCTLGYVGALTDKTWHSPKDLLRLYEVFREKVISPRLLIVTTSEHKEIKNYFKYFDKSEVEIVSAYSSAEVSRYLEQMQFGALPYRIPNGHLEKNLANTVFAVKTAEYLMHGIPVLCNQECRGAAQLISKNNLGIAYEPVELAEISKENLDNLLTVGVKKRIRECASNFMSYSSNVTRLNNLYKQLSK